MLPRRERRKIERRLDKAKKGGKMKRINYKEEFLTADGQKFLIPDPDNKAHQKVREEALAKGQDRWEVPRIEATFAQIIIWFVNNIPHGVERDKDGKPQLDKDGNPIRSTRKLTPEDSGNAYAVISAFKNVQDGCVELEESVYKWLVELNETDGVEAFSPASTQAVVAEKLDDFVKESEKAK